jgi:zinc protease
VSGDFEPVELLQELDRRFADWSKATSVGAPSAWPPPAPGDGSPPGLYHYEMDIPQAKVLLGRRLPKRLDWTERERFTLLALAEILGGQGAISRIAGRLRTAEGLVYRASATIAPGDLWPGDVQVFFETESGSTARAVELALEEIERLRTEPVHPTELDVVKQTLLAGLRLGLDTSEEIAGYFAEDALLDRPFDYRQTYYDEIDRLQPAEIQAVAWEYLRSDTFLYLTVGRWEEIAGTAGAGESTLERTVGHTRTLLPERDPLSLEPLNRPE